MNRRARAALITRERRAVLEQALVNRAMRHDKGPFDRLMTRIVQTQLPDTSSVAPAHQSRLDRPTEHTPGVPMTDRTPTATATVTVAAAPDAVYDLVSDLPRMGEWSPENTGGRWIGRRRGPVVGARFVGTNRNRWRRWPTTTVVVDATRGRRFAFETRLGPMTAAEWAYDITPTADGCEVTESWTDLRNRALITVGGPLTGVADRVAFTRTMLLTTLQRLKSTAEQR